MTGGTDSLVSLKLERLKRMYGDGAGAGPVSRNALVHLISLYAKGMDEGRWREFVQDIIPVLERHKG